MKSSNFSWGFNFKATIINSKELSFGLCFQDRYLVKVLFDPIPSFSMDNEISSVRTEWESRCEDYFSGNPHAFDNANLKFEGTSFQQEVWLELQKIKFGETVSYGELAARINRPRSFRAVANACGANPLPLVIPCHRVIASGGGWGGYSAGLWRKRLLLQMEQNLSVHPSKDR